MHYTQTKIKDIGDVVTGKTPPTANQDYYDGEIMFVTPNELHGDYLVEKSQKTITEAGLNSVRSNSIQGTSVMVGCIGWDMGNVAMCQERCVTNQQINSITSIKDDYDPYYVYSWLSSKKEYLFSIAAVTRTPILSKSDFEEVLISMPDLPVQKRVTTVLRSVDEKIRINNQINDNLRQMTMTIYDYWFTQFDFPDANGKPYRQSKGAFIHNDQLRKAIPVGWSVDSIIDNPLSSVITPGVDTFDIKEYLATANVNGTDILAGSLVDYENREGRANMQPAVNSIWFAKMKNSIKHLFLNKEMQPLIDQAILSTGFCGLQCSVNSFEYIASFIATPYFEVAKDTLAHGATQEAVNNDDMKSINLLIPPVDVLENYHEAVQPICSEISRNICENKRLVELRDWLLPMLMNGQVEVTN